MSADEKYGPVGAVVFCSYWREEYTVLSHNEDGTVTIRWHGKSDSLGLDRFPAGREATHRTPMDRGDHIVSLAEDPPRTPTPVSASSPNVPDDRATERP